MSEECCPPSRWGAKYAFYGESTAADTPGLNTQLHSVGKTYFGKSEEIYSGIDREWCQGRIADF
jgi:hypothetical protein